MPAKMRRNSSIFPALRVASTTLIRLSSARRSPLARRSLAQGHLLEAAELGAAVGGEGEQSVELGPVEGLTFRGALHLDEAPVARAHDVHVGGGGDVLFVAQVQPRLAVDDADADRGHRRD